MSDVRPPRLEEELAIRKKTVFGSHLQSAGILSPVLSRTTSPGTMSFAADEGCGEENRSRVVSEGLRELRELREDSALMPIFTPTAAFITKMNMITAARGSK